MRNAQKVYDGIRKVRFEVQDGKRNALFEALSGEGLWLGSEIGMEVEVGGK